MKVYIVIRQDYGLGESIKKVFASLSAAQKYVAESGDCYLDSKDGEYVEME